MRQGFRAFVEGVDPRGVVIVWATMTPPTKMYETIFNEAARVANRLNFDLKIYLSHQKPIPYAQKLVYARALFPRYAQYIEESDLALLTDIAGQLSKTYASLAIACRTADEESYDMIVAENPKDFDFYEVSLIPVVVEEMNTIASDLAIAGDIAAFRALIPSNGGPEMINRLYRDLRDWLGVPKETFDLPKDPSREKLFDGSLRPGDTVWVDELEGTVVSLGTNFVEVESNGRRKKYWPSDVMLAPKDK